MAEETDECRLRLLLEAFTDTASNVPEFTRTATEGHHRADEGLENLLTRDLSLYAKTVALKRAVAKFLRDGGRPSIERSTGDADMEIDTAMYYHFRVEVEGVRLFVKVFVEDDPHEPDVLVVSVKRDDRAWK